MNKRYSRSIGLDARAEMAYQQMVKCEICHENEAQPGRPNCSDGFCISVAMAKLNARRIEQERKALAYLGPDAFKAWKKQRAEFLAKKKLEQAIPKSESRVDKLSTEDSTTIGGYLTESPQAEALLAESR